MPDPEFDDVEFVSLLLAMIPSALQPTPTEGLVLFGASASDRVMLTTHFRQPWSQSGHLTAMLTEYARTAVAMHIEAVTGVLIDTFDLDPVRRRVHRTVAGHVEAVLRGHDLNSSVFSTAAFEPGRAWWCPSIPTLSGRISEPPAHDGTDR